MVWKKRASPAPAFKQPAPYDPTTGQYAPIGVPGQIPTCAMMQVIESDTHDNYVVCRGWDPDSRRYLDSVNVGKPYGLRGTNPYEVGQVHPAIKPITKLGTTPGKAETTVGHPGSLTEVVEILKDDAGNPIWWLLLDSTPAAGGPELVTVYQDGGASGGASSSCTFTYTIKTLAGVELATLRSPHKSRYPNTAYTQAPDGSYGLAKVISGTWQLMVAWQEIAQTVTCTDVAAASSTPSATPTSSPSTSVSATPTSSPSSSVSASPSSSVSGTPSATTSVTNSQTPSSSPSAT